MPTFVFQRGVSDSRISQDRATPLWRYQDLPKLLWTLSTGCLWFARADTVGDAYEGSLTSTLSALRREALKQMPGGFNLDEVEAWMSGIDRKTVQNYVMSCWHMNEYESAAMWKLYVAAGEGVAIRSTIERLLCSFPEGVASHPIDGSRPYTFRADMSNRDANGVPNVIAIEFGPVVYDDYLDSGRAARVPFTPRTQYFRKRKSFEHEREFRALTFALAVTEEGFADLAKPVFPDGGVGIPIDLDVLVEKIYVSPGSPSWFKHVVEDTVSRFGRKFSVVQSNLDVDPIF